MEVTRRREWAKGQWLAIVVRPLAADSRFEKRLHRIRCSVAQSHAQRGIGE